MHHFRNYLIIITLVFTTMASQAQRIHAYVNTGLAASQVEGDELKGFNHWGLTGGVGALADLSDNGMWAMTVETDYTCRGIYNRKSSADNLYNMKMNLHYVDIPLTLLFRDPYGGIQVGVGLVYGRLVSQPNGIIAYNPNFFIPDTSDMTFLKNDLSPALELRFTIWNNLKFSARYQFSVIPIKKGWKFTYPSDDETWTRDCYNSSVMMRLQWQFGEGDYRTNKYNKKKSHRR